MKKTNQFARIVFAVLFSVSALTLSGCSEKPNKLELMADNKGIGWDLMSISDIDENEKLRTKADVVYDVGFGNPSTHYTYGYVIDAIDGSILDTWSSEDMK